MKGGSGTRLAFFAAAVVVAVSAASGPSSGCWRSADCPVAPLSPPSADFRYDSGKAPATDFRSSTGELAGAGPLRLDGEPVAESERRLLRPENMRFRQYAAPTWPQPAGTTDSLPADKPARAYGE